jgi:hypothetical protein
VVGVFLRCGLVIPGASVPRIVARMRSIRPAARGSEAAAGDLPRWALPSMNRNDDSVGTQTNRRVRFPELDENGFVIQQYKLVELILIT